MDILDWLRDHVHYGGGGGELAGSDSYERFVSSLPSLEDVMRWAPADSPPSMFTSLARITDSVISKQVALTMITQWLVTKNLDNPMAVQEVEIPMIRFGHILLGSPILPPVLPPPPPGPIEPPFSPPGLSLLAVKGVDQVIKMRVGGAIAGEAIAGEAIAATESPAVTTLTMPHPVVGICAGEELGSFIAFAPKLAGEDVVRYSSNYGTRLMDIGSSLHIIPEVAIVVVPVYRRMLVEQAWEFVGAGSMPFPCAVWKAGSLIVISTPLRTWTLEGKVESSAEQDENETPSVIFGPDSLKIYTGDGNEIRVSSTTASLPIPAIVSSRTAHSTHQLGSMNLVVVSGRVRLANPGSESSFSPPIRVGANSQWTLPCQLMVLQRDALAVVAVAEYSSLRLDANILERENADDEEWVYAREPISVQGIPHIPHASHYTLIFDTTRTTTAHSAPSKKGEPLPQLRELLADLA